MSGRCGRSARHTVSVGAPASVVYGLLADAPRWPLFLRSCVHAERMDADARTDELLVWTCTDDQVRGARLRRTLRPAERTVSFEEFATDATDATDPASGPGPQASGTWSVERDDPAGEGRCLLTLHYERLGPGPFETPQAVARQVRDQLDQVEEIKAAAERWDTFDESLLSLANSARVDGAPELVYDLLHRVGDWPELLPHVDEATVREDRPGVQRVTLGLGAPPTGEPVTVTSVRLCFPHAGRIVHKEQVAHELVAAHSGEWSLVPDASGLTVTSTHQVLLRPQALAPGPPVDGAPARLRVGEWLTGTDRETLALIKWHAESPVRRLR
ncbi:SRPBCC family protein [Streptomyces sp. NPDC102406]|uniref:SRPBCC family protein n=1 Tax=Streptomyces sp. NPDC102406 TaxID=3366171 RepID=UPI0038179F21